VGVTCWRPVVSAGGTTWQWRRTTSRRRTGTPL